MSASLAIDARDTANLDSPPHTLGRAHRLRLFATIDHDRHPRRRAAPGPSALPAPPLISRRSATASTHVNDFFGERPRPARAPARPLAGATDITRALSRLAAGFAAGREDLATIRDGLDRRARHRRPARDAYAGSGPTACPRRWPRPAPRWIPWIKAISRYPRRQHSWRIPRSHARDGGFIRRGARCRPDEARVLLRRFAPLHRRIAGPLCRGDRVPDLGASSTTTMLGLLTSRCPRPPPRPGCAMR